MPLELRPARPGDAASLSSIDGLVSASPWSPAQFAAACGRAGDCGATGSGVAHGGERTLVLACAGEVCAFSVFTTVLDEASIHHFAVLPARQGKGLGRRLLRATLERMKDCGALRCLLEVRASNVAARRLYEACHFQLDGVRKNYYPAQNGPEDALLMSRRL